MTSSHISIAQIMLSAKHHHLFIFLYIVFVNHKISTNACNIWKASECPQPPTADDEKIFDDDLYTREQLYQFCDKGKRYVECINKRLQCCDLRSEHAGALAAFDITIQQAGWRLGRHCAGISSNAIITYPCKTTRSLPARTTTTTTSTTTTIPPCYVIEASRECNGILDDRLNFENHWSIREKIRWCQSTRNFVECAHKYITNCSIIDVREDVEQLSNFIDYIIKQADRFCYGGFYGCRFTVTDVRCTQTEDAFYSGKSFDGASKSLIIRWYLFFSVALVWCWNR